MITVLSPLGEELKNVSLLQCFLNSEYAPILAKMRKQGDVFHSNTIELLDGSTADRAPMFKKGRVLLSVRELDTIAVVDLDEEKVTWALTGMWRAQHQPELLENGNLLLFDNLGNNGRSRVIEFNPLTQEIAWEYGGDSTTSLFSRTSGSSHRLPNGNTLIVESDNGRVLEVTPEHTVVWEFLNPRRAGADNELIAVIFDMVRIAPDRIGWR